MGKPTQVQDLDSQRLKAMRVLGVRWRHGRLPLYPTSMSETAKRKADAYYDAMAEAFIDRMMKS